VFDSLCYYITQWDVLSQDLLSNFIVLVGKYLYLYYWNHKMQSMIQQNDHIQSHIYCRHQAAHQKLSNKNVVVCMWWQDCVTRNACRQSNILPMYYTVILLSA